MGRRRWRFVAIAAILLIYVKDTKCQDNFYIPQPVERNFAQVQPPLFNNRPSTIFDHSDYRVAPTFQQPLYNDGRVRFPSPNYNQNPSPFQLPTRTQNNPQYTSNPAEFISPQRQRIRQPFNYEFQHPASTIRPDTSQIHSVAYQNDPSKPEAFLGQVTLNNPDIDFLQQNRFKNIQFDGNSLKSNGQSGHISHDEIDNDDLYDQPKATTYNPNKNKLRLSTREESKYALPPIETEVPEKYPIKYLRHGTKPKVDNNFSNQNSEASTEYKELLGLLEDDVSDISKFTELMKNPKTSFDVEVINSNNSDESIVDSKPSATSMSADNAKSSKTYYSPRNKLRNFALTTTTTSTSTSTTTTTTTTEKPHKEEHSHEAHDKYEEEYSEYYDESEVPESTTIIEFHKSEEDTDLYDDYDTTEEQHHTEEVKTHTHATEIPKTEVSQIKSEEPKTNTTPFDILIMKPNKTMVKDDNFHDFVDTSIIDQTTEQIFNNESSEISTSSPVSYEEYSSVETPSILGQEIVSVVTTKSVVNGTIAIPDVTFSPSTVRINAKAEDSSMIDNENDTSVPMTTENWIVVASVQTSRSVSGARFLPFPGVEQEEKKQVLSDDKEEDLDSEQVTSDPNTDFISSSMNNSSTENINDKLDSIQSELSSAVLSGTLSNDNKNIELITETTTETFVPNVTTIATTQGPLNVFTLKMIQSSTESEKSAPDPLPVLIKKFTHRSSTTSTSTTPKPKKKLVTVMDDLAGFLPPGYKPRLSFKDKRTSTTSTTTSTTTTTTPMPSTKATSSVINGTQGRSSGINSKNRVIVLDDKSLIPKEYRPKETKLKEDIFKTIDEESISKFLPPGYKPSVSEESNEKVPVKPSILDKIEVQKVDITSFLPKGFKLNESSEETRIQTKSPSTKLPKPVAIDFASLLPPGYKLNSSESNSKEESSLETFKIADISNLLPPGFNPNSTEESDQASDSASTTKGPGSFKVVFPSRPAGKSTRKPILKATSSGPPPITPKIQKGWPTRASTEFTGWPTVSTTPFSFDKLLETIKSTSPTSREDLPEVVTRRTTTTTTTTTPKPAPITTPGICHHNCDIAATIKLVSGAKWVPELLDHHTEEWQNLAKELKQELNSVYSKSDLLKKWYKGVRIDSFSEGSVLVDYIIELNEIEEKVDTQTLKKMFHRSLHDAKPGSVVESVHIEKEEDSDDFDPDMMQGDQPDEERMKKSNEKMTKTIDKSAGKLEIGKFVMDPAYTEFIVLPRREEPKVVEPEEEAFLPQWGIAVIVIALASLLFVVIFGVTVLVNRQKSAKAKQPIPLSEDMFRDLDKNHMGGFDDMNLNEREHPYSSGKSVSTAAFIEQLAYSNPGDSWRSEWTPQMQKYMQHYTPDSGRGSQIYGHAGNQYGPGRQVSFRRSLRGESRKYKRYHHPFGYGGGGGSQLYGHLGGGGSQGYGYTGEYPRGQYPVRRRSDYDTNF